MYKKFSGFVTSLQSNAWYALFLLLLAVLGASMLIYEFGHKAAKADLIVTLHQIDLLIAYLFLLDFFLGLFFNTKYTKSEYWRKNWLDFISSIPITADVARTLRILRIFRALRVISTALDVWFTRHRYQNVKKMK